MRDLSKLNIQKKQDNNDNQEIQKSTNSKKKILLVIVVVFLLVVAVASKLVNKHLKKIKAEQEKAKAELQEKTSKDITENNKATKTDDKKDSNLENKMVFTFYDNLKHDTVKVDVVPEAQRAQYKYTYVYQVSSFRSMDEAAWYVKKMKEVGLNPQFKKVGNWIRMYIGPYDSKRAMAPDIIKLQRIGLNGGFPREISRTKIEPSDANKDQKSQSSNKDDSTDNTN